MSKKPMSKETTVAKYNRIQVAVEARGPWSQVDNRAIRAARVMEAARAEGCVFQCSPLEVADFMGQMPYWNQGPSNYLDAALGLSLILKNYQIKEP